MLQKEVVDRIAASPGNKQYGRLSVILQYRYQVEHLFTVPPTAFFPKPKVDSAVVRLTPRAEIEPCALDIDDLSSVVKMAFSQRRKTLRNTLKPLLSAERIEALGIDPSTRAETLSVADFVALANETTQSGGTNHEQ
jgi:16S rRNA (adenine1518-N6/adenine1519-N6)-dimethyltransferase